MIWKTGMAWCNDDVSGSSIGLFGIQVERKLSSGNLECEGSDSVTGTSRSLSACHRKCYGNVTVSPQGSHPRL